MAAITLKRNSYFDEERCFQLGLFYNKITTKNQIDYSIGIAFGFWSIQFEWLK
jgi:hypothetical protein